jgi:hypothetical protein
LDHIIRKKIKKLRRKPNIFLRIVLVLVIILSSLSYLSINVIAAINDSLSSQKKSIPFQVSPANITTLPEVKGESIKIAEVKKDADEKRKLEVAKQMAIRDGHIKRINKFLIKKHSPVANTNIAEILYDLSVKYNGDYRTILAISGVESGFCAASFSYNCFGFLNGVKYTSYEQAFKDIVPKIIKNYLHRYGATNFVSIAKSYGMINWEKGSANLKMYYNQI